MEFSLEHRTVSLGIGELAEFRLGPRGTGGGPAGLWRAQLGQHWHTELRQRVAGVPGARFEVPLQADYRWRGWLFSLTGRIDQILPGESGPVLREIKTVSLPLPAEECALRASFPGYFLQLAAYLALVPESGAARGELVFVEIATGLVQTLALGAGTTAEFHAQLDQLVEFLEHRLRARERRRGLRVRPPFASPRPGQETVQADLRATLDLSRPPPYGGAGPVLFFEAPTGYGKTGVLLEFALHALRDGACDRVVYLTGKSTGQWQVVRQLAAMTAPTAGDDRPALPYWQVRSKSEHCVNTLYHCLPAVCPFLDGMETRWPGSGLARFYLFDDQPRDLESLRAAGHAARICPYEITRAALPFNDVWIGDYNYVFAPSNRGLFFDQPGFDPRHTLLLVDEAHNLPARVADAHSQHLEATTALFAAGELRQMRAPVDLVLAWERWAHLLDDLTPREGLSAALADDVRTAVRRLSDQVATTALDYATLSPTTAELLWQMPALAEILEQDELPYLLWAPRRGTLQVTCLDAAPAIAAVLRQFRAAILASATLSPVDALAAACGLDRPPPDARAPAAAELPTALGKLSARKRRALAGLTTGAALLQLEESRTAAAPLFLRAPAPWRAAAYRVAIDRRVDTRFGQRARFYDTTTATLAALVAAPDRTGPVVAFFPSYAYAEAVRERCAAHPAAAIAVALQPRGADLAAQAAFITAELERAEALFLVLGSGFTEGIDALGGRVSHALVVGPALPEVNAVQQARLAARAAAADGGRTGAFRHVYQIPGMTKVNQALGRLVRAPGQRVSVLLHCQRFAEQSYRELLDPDCRSGACIDSTAELAAWLGAAGAPDEGASRH
jgi:DNA excision repair protein ERCC-2